MGRTLRCVFVSTLLGSTLVSPGFASQEYWSGPYIGASVRHHDVETSGVFDGPELGITPDLNGIGDNGIHLGIHGGANFQIDEVVLGLEGDLAVTDFKQSMNTVQDGTATEAGLLSYPLAGDLEHLVTLRARLGFDLAAMFKHPILVFGTAGVARTQFKLDIANGRDDVGFTATAPVWGGGMEVPISNSVTLRADYLHMSFSDELNISDEVTSGVFDANDGNYVRLEDVDMWRIGFNVKLGTWH